MFREREESAARGVVVSLAASALVLLSALVGAESWDGSLAGDDVMRDLGAEVTMILRDNCAACHTPASNSLADVKYKGDFDSLLDFDRLRSSEYLNLASPLDSELYLMAAEKEMPPYEVVKAGHARHLTEPELTTLLAWIRAGAPDAHAVRADNVGASEENLEVGRAAFFASCTACHPASRALDKTKSFTGWLSTVDRMADKAGARIDPSKFGAIAAYLAQESAKRTPVEDMVSGEQAAWWEAFRVNGTVSAMWRGSARSDRMDNPGFVAEVWVSAEWHPTDSPFSARVTACTTCHDAGSAIELAEAALSFDISQVLHSGDSLMQSSLEAGRFIVPFGSFSSQSNPAAYRTVTRPLLYNMGQMVDRTQVGAPVLPMPYSDEGFKLDLSAPIGGDVSADFDVYVVNGLQGNIDVNYYQSRSYTDNNGDPALGGRLVVGTPSISVGASAMTGNSEGTTGNPERIGYQIIGMDLNARYGERLRFIAEVARRSNDQLTFVSATPVGSVDVEGYVAEADFLLSKDNGISLVVRLDAMRYDGTVDPITSSLGPSFRVDRVTWGFDLASFGGSSLMLNHEHWSMPDTLDDVDVLGLRWVMSF